MTPLLYRVANELTLPLKRRSLHDEAGLLRRLDDVHAFDVTAVLPMMRDLSVSMLQHPDRIGVLAFLPAPRTWIEWVEGAYRVGVLLEQDCDTATISISASDPFSSRQAGQIALRQLLIGANEHDTLMSYWSNSAIGLDAFKATALRCYAALALINTPRHIGRKQHMPHAGLQRRLSSALGMVGKFPMHATTEIVLRVSVPSTEHGQVRDTHLTGQRALHWVRTHLRHAGGTLVMQHWRGNPALGIVQSRYTIRP